MNLSQMIIGTLLVVFGVVMVFVALVSGFSGGGFVALVYGIPALVLGVLILLNKKEDYVEPIKKRERRSKK